MESNMVLIYTVILMILGIVITEIFPGGLQRCLMQGRQRIFYRSNEDNLSKLLVCRNQYCLSRHLSGIEWWCGITGLFPSETAYYYSAAGWNFFRVCQKWSDDSFADLVGISDY